MHNESMERVGFVSPTSISKRASQLLTVTLVASVSACGVPEGEKPAESNQSRRTTSAQTPSRFTGAVLVTSAADVNDKLDYYRRIHPMDLGVEDQFLFAGGVWTNPVKKICASSGNNCRIDVSGYQAFKKWLHALTVVGPHVPMSTVQLGPCAAAARTTCENKHTNCGAMRFGDLLVAQRRELAISSEATHARLHDATISDIGSMPLACWTGSGSPPVFKSVFPQAIYRAEIPMDNGLDELFQYHANKHWIECKDSTTDTCAIFAERKLITEATGLLGLSVIGRAYTWATQTNENTKVSSYYRPAISHIADLTFLGYESTCDVLIKDIDQNNHVFKTGDCKPVSGAKPFIISFPSTQGAILKYTFFEDKNTPLTPALALQTTYTPSSSDAKIFGKSTVRAPIKPNTTGAATYATAISRPFCGIPNLEKPVP